MYSQYDQNLIIPPPLPWQADQQNSSTPHRDSKYRPSILPPPTTLYPNLIFKRDQTTRRTARIYMWPRLLDLSRSLMPRHLRFADTRSRLKFADAPPPKQNPLPDDRSLSDTYTTLGNTIRQIHRIDDVIIEGERYRQFIHQLQHAAGRLAERENRRFTRRQGDVRPHFMWLHDFANSIADCLDEMGAIENWLSNQTGNHDTLRRLAMTAAERNIPEMTRLLAFLIERDHTFHEQFFAEHTFGCLNDKRISLLEPYQWAELYEICNVLPSQHARSIGLLDWEIFFDMTESNDPVYRSVYDTRLRTIYRLLRQHQIELRDIFEYRQVLEWGFKPLWKQLYVTVKPELGISDDTIDKYLEWTKLDHLTNSFFTIKPVRSDHFDNKDCPICLCNLKDSEEIQGKMIVELKCGHFFHTECIIPHFDSFNSWQNRCPVCRHSAGSLRTMMDGVFLEAEDVDYDLPGLQVDGRSIRDEINAYNYGEHLRALISVMDLGPDHQNAYWQRQLRWLLTLKRDAREANFPMIEALYYGT